MLSSALNKNNSISVLNLFCNTFSRSTRITYYKRENELEKNGTVLGEQQEFL